MDTLVHWFKSKYEVKSKKSKFAHLIADETLVTVGAIRACYTVTVGIPSVVKG